MRSRELDTAGRRTLILAASHDKDVRAIVRELVPHFDRVVVTAVPGESSRGTSRLNWRSWSARNPRDGRKGASNVCATPGEAWENACRGAAPGELVCVAGSFYLAAELRPLILKSSQLDRQNLAAP